MAKTKLDPAQDGRGSTKRKAESQEEIHRPQKKARILLESDSSDDDLGTPSPPGGVAVTDGTNIDEGDAFQVNQEFARRFEHNKEREELHSCMIKTNLL